MVAQRLDLLCEGVIDAGFWGESGMVMCVLLSVWKRQVVNKIYCLDLEKMDDAKDRKRIPLSSFVFREFFKAALMPLLFIELALILLYFGINSYNQKNSAQTLEQEITSHLGVIVDNRTKLLSEQLAGITELAGIVQKQVEDFYNNPGKITKSGGSGEYGFAANGVYYKLHNDGGSSLYYSTVTDIGEEQKKIAQQSEVLDGLFQYIHEANKNIVAVYYNSHDSMNRYYPFIDNVYEQFLPNMVIPDFNFYYLADRQHNPERKIVWTETYLDPAGQGWMMSCIAPVYRGDFLEGVIGIDVTIGNFLNNMLKLQVPWGAGVLLVNHDGTIMAMSESVEALFGLSELREYKYHSQVAEDTHKPEEFNLLKIHDAGLASRMEEILRQKSNSVLELMIGGDPYLLSQATEDFTGWKLMVLAQKAEFLRPMLAQEENALHIGYFAIVGMIGFYTIFSFYLFYNARRISKQIATPVVNIAEQSRHVEAGDYKEEENHSDIYELDMLNKSFYSMVVEIRELHGSLREEIGRANLELEERKITQEALKKSEEKLSGIFNHTIECIGLLDKDGKVTHANKTALDFAGISEEEAIGKPFWDTVWWQHSEEARQSLIEAVTKAQSGEVVRMETTHVNRDGQMEYIDLSITPVFDTSGKVSMMIPESRIISDLKMVQEELIVARDAAESANRSKSEFIGNMSHELRTPLNHIIGFTGMLLEKNFGPLNERQEKFLKNVLDGGNTLLALVNDLLDIAQMESGQDELNMQTFDLRAVLEHSFAMIREKASKKRVELKSDIDSAPVNFYADERKIKQIIYNLLSNSVKFTGEDGEISLKAKIQETNGTGRRQKSICVEIADTGIGLEKKDIERIFGNFEQADASITRNFQGAGLGLPLTKYFVEMHGGRIWAESEGLHKGSVFIFTIPFRAITV